MEKKDIQKLFLVFIAILLIAGYVDITGGQLSETGTIERDAVGGDEKEIQLLVEVEDVLDSYEYVLEVEPQRVTKEEADIFFSQAITEIQESFGVEKDSLQIENTYVSKLVKAEWCFTPGNYVYSDGFLRKDKIPEEGVLMQATVVLTCGEYEQIYSFPFLLEKPEVSEQQQVLEALRQEMETQTEKEGTAMFQLPTKINGHQVHWSEKQEYLTLKILGLEIVAVLLLMLSQKQKKVKEQENLKLQMELDYPEVVNQLSILLEAGMTTRQAWGRIASQYENKKKTKATKESFVFEQIVMMSHRLLEGENERVAYESFVKKIDHPQYRRLIRMLVNNLEKGAKGICEYLEEESRQAYEQRILLAKRLGEEASTKMLLPMMLMMILVMAIVMVPALISFSV